MVLRELVTLLGFEVDEKGVNKYENTFSKLVTMATHAAAVVGSFKLGQHFLDSAGQVEQTTVAFTTMLGTAERAATLMKDIESFAAATPFQEKDLTQYAKQLTGYGFAMQDIIPTMKALGDISAGVGTDKLPSIVLAFGKIKTKGKATMEELNIMLEAGVPILDQLAKQFGVTKETITKMVSQGKIGFNDINKAMNAMSGSGGRFSDLMAKQSKTWFGIVSNIQDVLEQISKAIGAEMLPIAKEFGNAILGWLGTYKKLIVSNIAGFFKGIGYIIAYVVLFVNRLINSFGGIEKIMKIVNGVIGFALGLFDAFWTVIEGIINILWPFRFIILAIVGALMAFNAILVVTNILAAMNPFALIAIGIMALITIIVLIKKHFKEIAAFFMGIGNFFIGIWNKVGKAFGNVWKGIVKAFKDAWSFIKDALTSPVIQGLLAIFLPFIGLPNLIIQNWASITKFFTDMVNKIKEILDPFLKWVEGVFKRVGAFFEQFDGKKKGSGAVIEEFDPNYEPGNIGEKKKGLKTVPKTGAEKKDDKGNVVPKVFGMGERIYQNNYTNEVTVTVALAVPEGTAESQKTSLRSQAKDIVQGELQKVLRGLNYSSAGASGNVG